jgi:coenzyme F420-0:L-glutamate ligase/coenzyme F420-1:gamma-L-glutamate ligase
VNVAIGVAGLRPLRSFLGVRDPQGYPLQATVQAVADELAAAADLLFGKLDRVPAAIIRGFPYEAGEASIQELIRPPDRDLFR